MEISAPQWAPRKSIKLSLEDQNIVSREPESVKIILDLKGTFSRHLPRKRFQLCPWSIGYPGF